MAYQFEVSLNFLGQVLDDIQIDRGLKINKNQKYGYPKLINSYVIEFILEIKSLPIFIIIKVQISKQRISDNTLKYKISEILSCLKSLFLSTKYNLIKKNTLFLLAKMIYAPRLLSFYMKYMKIFFCKRVKK